MKPWIKHALVWVGVIGLATLVVERIDESRSLGHAVVVGIALLVLIVALGLFSTFAFPTINVDDFSRDCGLDDLGCAPPESGCSSEDSKEPGSSARSET